MPIFDFKCPNCDAVKKDVVLRVTSTKKDFPTCCGLTMEKQWAMVNAHFRGAGFHATDYHAPTRGF